MERKTRTNMIISSLDSLSIDELTRVSDRIHSLLESKRLAEAIATDVLEPTSSTKSRQTPKRQGSAEWFETKIIKGHAYRYRRWWENGKKRSEYAGKA